MVFLLFGQRLGPKKALNHKMNAEQNKQAVCFVQHSFYGLMKISLGDIYIYVILKYMYLRYTFLNHIFILKSNLYYSKLLFHF